MATMTNPLSMIDGTQGQPFGQSANPVPSSMLRPVASPIASGSSTGVPSVAPTPSAPSSIGSTSAAPGAPFVPPGFSNVPGYAAPVGGGFLAGNLAQKLDDQMGSGLGSTIANFLSTLDPSTANSIAQAIINANAPNVQKGQDQINEQLAASGISPSSSVSALETGDYQANVQKEDLAEIAQVNLTQEGLAETLLTNLIPGQTKQQQSESGWNIFNNVMQGLGTAAGAFLNPAGG